MLFAACAEKADGATPDYKTVGLDGEKAASTSLSGKVSETERLLQANADADGMESNADEDNAGNAAEKETGFPWTPSDGDQIAFKVLRKGKDFGTHTIRFVGDAEETLNVQVSVSLRAGLGPFTAYRYELDVEETWQQGNLVALSGSANDDGEDLRVEASRDGDQLTIDGTEFSGSVDVGILPISHWNKDQVSATRLVSTEDGEILDVSSEKLGRETINVNGESVDADHYLMKSDIGLDLWYDTENRLVKLAFEARGQSIEYVLESLY